MSDPQWHGAPPPQPWGQGGPPHPEQEWPQGGPIPPGQYGPGDGYGPPPAGPPPEQYGPQPPSPHGPPPPGPYGSQPPGAAGPPPPPGQYGPGPQPPFGAPGGPLPGPPPMPPARGGGSGKTIAIVVGSVLAVVVLGVGAVLLAPFLLGGSDEPSGAGTPTAAVENHGLVVGDGPVTVEVYLDFGCPPCADFHAANADLIDATVDAGDIRVVYHPLDFLDYESPNSFSSRAASAAVCAADQGNFPAYAGALFAEQPEPGTAGPDDARLVDLGASLGLGGDFETCVLEGWYLDWIAEGTTSSGMSSVPTIVIDGTTLENRSLFEDELTDAIGA